VAPADSVEGEVAVAVVGEEAGVVPAVFWDGVDPAAKSSVHLAPPSTDSSARQRTNFDWRKTPKYPERS